MQALGGDMVFQHRFGFSGTPSDLLPKELGRCHYEKAVCKNDALFNRYKCHI